MLSITTLIAFLCALIYVVRRSPGDLEIIIMGLIPSLSGASTKQERGTTVILFYKKTNGEILKDDIIKRGYADEKGEFRARVPREKVGEVINCKVLQSRYKFLDRKFLLQPHGAIYVVDMIPDDSDMSGARGADVGNLREYSDNATLQADQYRQNAIDRLRWAGLRLGDIPVLIWLAIYLLSIFVFSIDYYFLMDAFDRALIDWLDALYFSAVTVTTLGYGEVVPTEPLAKLLTSIQAVSGVMFAGLFLNSLFSDK